MNADRLLFNDAGSDAVRPGNFLAPDGSRSHAEPVEPFDIRAATFTLNDGTARLGKDRGVTNRSRQGVKAIELFGRKQCDFVDVMAHAAEFGAGQSLRNSAESGVEAIPVRATLPRCRQGDFRQWR
jgi:hypothetical protein